MDWTPSPALVDAAINGDIEAMESLSLLLFNLLQEHREPSAVRRFKEKTGAELLPRSAINRLIADLIETCQRQALTVPEMLSFAVRIALDADKMNRARRELYDRQLRETAVAMVEDGETVAAVVERFGKRTKTGKLPPSAISRQTIWKEQKLRGKPRKD